MRSISSPIRSKAAGAIMALAVLSLLCCSCKGRTLKNVEATGETVDVVIPEAADAEEASEAMQMPASVADTTVDAAVEDRQDPSADSLHKAPLQFQKF